MRRRTIRLARPVVATCIAPEGGFFDVPRRCLVPKMLGQARSPAIVKADWRHFTAAAAPHGAVSDNYATLLGIRLAVPDCTAGA